MLHARADSSKPHSTITLDNSELLFHYLYSEVTAEMLLRKEYRQACMALRNFTHNILRQEDSSNQPPVQSATAPGQGVDGPVLKELMKAFIHYIHSAHLPTNRKHLVSLISGKNEVKDDDDDELDLISKIPEATAAEQQLQRKASVYSSLLGTAEESALTKFTSMEDQFLYGGLDAKKNIPNFFPQLLTGLDELKGFGDDSDGMMSKRRESAMQDFWARYYSYTQVTNQHIFQFPLKMGLKYIKNREWDKVELVLLPFNQLRPLIVLVAWDEFDNKYRFRKELIDHLWRNQEEEAKAQCSEPRLTRWCDRLMFHVDMVSIILMHDHELSTEDRERQDAEGNRLLQTLHTQSILHSLRSYLPSLPPSTVVKRFSKEKAVDLQHDLHVLRGFYAIRCILELIDEYRASNINISDPRPPIEQFVEAARQHILAMTKSEFQITTLEKIWCCVFITRKQWAAKGREVATSSASTWDDADPNYAEEEEGQDDDADRFELSGECIIRLLNFLVDLIPLVVNDENEITDLTNTRLRSLERHVREGVWRLKIVMKIGQEPAVKHLISPLRSMSSWLLSMDKDDEAQLNPTESLDPSQPQKNKDYTTSMSAFKLPVPLKSQGVDADEMVKNTRAWFELCKVVRSTDKGGAGVVDMIYNNCTQIANDDPVDLNPSLVKSEVDFMVSRDLNLYFYLMDVAIIFPNKLTPEHDEQIMDKALTHLQREWNHNKDSKLMKFYQEYAHHRKNKGTHWFMIDQLAEERNFGHRKALDESAEAKAEYMASGQHKWVSYHDHVISPSAWSLTSNEFEKGEVRSYIDAYHHYLVMVDPFQNDNLQGPYKGQVGRRTVLFLAEQSALYRATVLKRIAKEQRGYEQKLGDSPDVDSWVGSGGYLHRLDPHIVAVLAKQILPSLAAVRYVAPAIHWARADHWEKLVETVNEETRTLIAEQEKMDRGHQLVLDAYSRWVDWRMENYKLLFKLTNMLMDESSELLTDNQASRTATEDAKLAVKDMRDMFREETVFSDQKAHRRLVQCYLNFFENEENERRNGAEDDREVSIVREGDSQIRDTPEETHGIIRLNAKKYVLEVSDRTLNSPAEPQASRIIQRLLMTTIPDCDYDAVREPPLRSVLILRLNDILLAAEFTLKYIDEWDDPDVCIGVLLKCLTSLDRIDTGLIRYKIEFKYHIILLYKELIPVLARKAQPALPMFSSWQAMEKTYRDNLQSVISVLIKWKQVEIAQKMFALYQNECKMEGRPASPQVDIEIIDQLESASLAALLSQGSSTRDRLIAIKRLQTTPHDRIFRVTKELVNLLEDNPPARYLVTVFLSRHLRVLSEDGMAVEEKTDLGRADYEKESKDVSGWSKADMHDYITEYRPKEMIKQPPQEGRPAFYTILELKEDFWLQDALAASKMLVKLPQNVQKELAFESSNPYGIMAWLLARGRPQLVTLVFPVFKNYCRDSSPVSVDSAIIYALSFAHQILALGHETEELGVGMEMGLFILDLALEHDKHQEVGINLLSVCDRLSCKLSGHPHPFLLLNLIKRMLVYFKKNCSGKVDNITENAFKDYYRIVFGDSSDEETSDTLIAALLSPSHPPTFGPLFFSLNLSPDKAEVSSQEFPLVYALRNIGFRLSDLVRPERAKQLRKRLIQNDFKVLAERVWVDCEHRDPGEFEDMWNDMVERFAKEKVAEEARL